MQIEEQFSLLLWCIMGVCIFSFLNVVIYRVPRKLDFVSGRSQCPSCGHMLGAKDLVPVFSWIFLGGKCRYCKSKISPRYSIIEIWGGICGTICWYFWGNSIEAILYFCVFSLLTVISCVDWDTMLILNGFVIVFFILTIVSCFFIKEISLLERIIGFFSISVPMLLLTVAISGAFGGGDIKLMAVAGFFLGWKLCVLSFFIGVILGGGYGVYLLLVKKKGRKDHFPFGPFLCLGIMIAVCFGNDFLAWYFQGLF